LKTGQNLIDAVRAIELETRCGLGLRVISYKYRHDSLGIAGSYKTGGRYNIREGFPDSFGSLYVAGDLETAEIEAGSTSQAQRWQKSYYTAIYKLLVADLRQADNVHEIGITESELNCEWKVINEGNNVVPTQELGLAFYKHTNAQALIYPSAKRPQGYNLVIFPDKINSDYYLKSRIFFYSHEEIGQDIDRELPE
jgi:RES domain-containing protein